MPTKTRALARSSLAAAAGVAALYLGSVLPGIKLSILFLAALGVVFVRLSCPGSWAWGCFAVTAALALLLLPDKTLALLYALLPGYYPIVKLRLERRKACFTRLRWLCGCWRVRMLRSLLC